MDYRLTALTIGYRKGRSVLGPLTATLHGGRLTALLGINGSGKTTLMRTMAGMLPPLGGQLHLGGEEVTSLTPRKLARLLSIVLTERVAAEGLTAEELVSLGRSPYTDHWGRLTPRDREAARRAMEIAGVEHLSRRETTTLSDGELQRVMIARALAQETPLILLDEPTAFLDYPSKLSVMRLLGSLAHDAGKAILLSTHDLHLALSTADTLWIIQPPRQSISPRTPDHSSRTPELSPRTPVNALQTPLQAPPPIGGTPLLTGTPEELSPVLETLFHLRAHGTPSR